MAAFTVVGGAGFVGSALVRHLVAEGHTCRVPSREEPAGDGALAHVIYCAGLTGDWIARPYDTVDAHVGALSALACRGRFKSLLYLSSTRVYDRHRGPLAREDDELLLRPQDGGDLYALSKAAGEAVTLAAGGRVARLSNVYGPRAAAHDFLSSLLSASSGRGSVMLDSALDSSRDFVSLADVVPLLARVAVEGRERVYNVASGIALTNRELTGALAELTGCAVHVRPGAPRVLRAAIDISRVRGEFGFNPARLLDDLPGLLGAVAP